MTHKLDVNINVNAETNNDDSAGPVQTGGRLKLFSSTGRRLRLWAAAQLLAHHNRVLALGVYRHHRLDGSRTLDDES